MNKIEKLKRPSCRMQEETYAETVSQLNNMNYILQHTSYSDNSISMPILYGIASSRMKRKQKCWYLTDNLASL